MGHLILQRCVSHSFIHARQRSVGWPLGVSQRAWDRPVTRPNEQPESDGPSRSDVGSVEVREGLRRTLYLFILFIFIFPAMAFVSSGCGADEWREGEAGRGGARGGEVNTVS